MKIQMCQIYLLVQERDSYFCGFGPQVDFLSFISISHSLKEMNHKRTEDRQKIGKLGENLLAHLIKRGQK